MNYITFTPATATSPGKIIQCMTQNGISVYAVNGVELHRIYGNDPKRTKAHWDGFVANQRQPSTPAPKVDEDELYVDWLIAKNEHAVEGDHDFPTFEEWKSKKDTSRIAAEQRIAAEEDRAERHGH